jgi:hypothetical protein
MADVFFGLRNFGWSHRRVTWAKLRAEIPQREKFPANGSPPEQTVGRGE